MSRRTEQPTPRPRTMPICGGCGKSGRVLYQGYCSGCIKDEDDQEAPRG